MADVWFLLIFAIFMGLGRAKKWEQAATKWMVLFFIGGVNPRDTIRTIKLYQKHPKKQE